MGKLKKIRQQVSGVSQKLGGVGQGGRSIFRSGTKMIKDPTKIPGEVVKGGLLVGSLGIPFAAGHYANAQIQKSRRAKSQEEAAYLASLEEQARQTDAMAGDALKKYQSGELTEGEQTGIDKQRDIRKAQLKQALGDAGVQDSSTGVQAEGDVESMRAAEMDKAMDEEFTKAMTLLGLDKDASDIISQMNREDRLAAGQAYAATITALGKIGGAATGGK